MFANIGDYSALNSFICGGIAVLANFILMLIIYKRTLSAVGKYRYLMYLVCVQDIAFSILFIITSPVLAAVEEYGSILFVKGGILVPMQLGRILLCLCLCLVCISIVTPPCLFLYRFIQICKPRVTTTCAMNIIFFVPILLGFPAGALLSFCMYPDHRELTLFGDVASNMNQKRNGAFLVASFKEYSNGGTDTLDYIKSKLLIIGVSYISILLVISAIIMIVCWGAIAKVNSAFKGSPKTIRLQKQLQRTLITQMLVPLICLHLPFYICCMLPLMGISTGPVEELIPLLFSWGPMINPIVVIISVRDFRHYAYKVIFERKLDSFGAVQPSNAWASSTQQKNVQPITRF